MPLQKILFKPGVNRENTRYTTEGGWYECNKIRFRQGNPEKIGGWTQYSTYTYQGVCRSLWNWFTLSNQNLIGVGTNLKFYLTSGDLYYDITPVRLTVTLPNNPLATDTATNAGGKTTITVTTTSAHGALINDFVTISGATTVAGVTVSGEYQITNIPSATTFKILATGTASSSTSGGGASVTAVFQVNTGPSISVPFNGWGAGAWGQYGTTWGNGGTSITNLQIWNQFNFGQNLLYGPRSGAIYYWRATTGVNTPGVLLSSLGGTATFTNASPTVVTFTVDFTEGAALQFTASGSMPVGMTANTTYYVFNKNGLTSNLLDVNGAIVNTTSTGTGVSVSLIVDVPLVQNNLTVSDASRFTIVMGTNDYGSSTMDPMLIRWSAQEDPFNWTPDATNQAGSVRLSHGSQIVTFVQTRQEIVIFTDASVYSFQYIGPPYVWQTQLLGDNISIISSNSAVIASGIVYWMGVDKFYAYDGRIQTLNCDLRRFIFQNINLAQSQQVFASTNEGFNEVWWFYCSGTSTTIDTYVVYNYLEKIWYYGSMSRTAWIDSGLQNFPVAATYDSTEKTGKLLNHEDGIDDNATSTSVPIAAYIASSEFDIGDGHNFAFVWRVLPDLTFSGSTASTPTVTMTLYGLDNSGSGVTSDAYQPVNGTNTYTITEKFTGQIYTRFRGRQMIFQIDSAGLGTTWQLGAPRIDIRPDGRR
jgi:hypothetical protein